MGRRKGWDRGRRKAVIDLGGSQLLAASPQNSSPEAAPARSVVGATAASSRPTLGLVAYGSDDDSDTNSDNTAPGTAASSKVALPAAGAGCCGLSTARLDGSADEVIAAVHSELAPASAAQRAGSRGCTYLQALQFQDQCQSRLHELLRTCVATCAVGADSAATEAADAAIAAADAVVASAFPSDTAPATGVSNPDDGHDVSFTFTASELSFLLATAHARAGVASARTACLEGWVDAQEAVSRAQTVVSTLPAKAPPRFEQDASALPGANVTKQHGDEALPPGWMAVWDASSEAYYYAHPESVRGVAALGVVAPATLTTRSMPPHVGQSVVGDTTGSISYGCCHSSRQRCY